MLAKDEVSSSTYPTVSSHGDRHRELEQELVNRYEELVDNYNQSMNELCYVEECNHD